MTNYYFIGDSPLTVELTEGMYNFGEQDLDNNLVFASVNAKVYDIPGVYDFVDNNSNNYFATVTPGENYNIVSKNESTTNNIKTIELIYDDINTGSRYSMSYTESYTAPVTKPELTLNDLNDAVLALTDIVLGGAWNGISIF